MRVSVMWIAAEQPDSALQANYQSLTVDLKAAAQEELFRAEKTLALESNFLH